MTPRVLGSLRFLLACIAICIFGAVAGTGRDRNIEVADQDKDGLPDEFEQVLLVRFAPAFHISDSDCDAAPAEFAAGSREPRVVEKNGTIYGQIFPVHRAGAAGAFVEAHYYHLWGRDCGRVSHALDVESISVLLRADRPEQPREAWRAEYWYAAAHENTLCDMSNGANAAALGTVERGPTVWISKDKHASFLGRELCSRGCGNDTCDSMKPLKILKIVNIGERRAPMNGAHWSASTAWPLYSKMDPDFTDALIARMPGGHQADLVPARDVVRGMRSTIKIADATFGALTSANASTEAAVVAGGEGAALGLDAAVAAAGKSANAVGLAFSSAGKPVQRAGRWLGFDRGRQRSQRLR